MKTISYLPLEFELKRKRMTKTTLKQLTKLSSATISKISKNEEPFNFTATSFQVYTHPSNGLNTVQWKVCGYLAEGWN